VGAKKKEENLEQHKKLFKAFKNKSNLVGVGGGGRGSERKFGSVGELSASKKRRERSQRIRSQGTDIKGMKSIGDRPSNLGRKKSTGKKKSLLTEKLQGEKQRNSSKKSPMWLTFLL